MQIGTSAKGLASCATFRSISPLVSFSDKAVLPQVFSIVTPGGRGFPKSSLGADTIYQG
jgi:hypothetical protein